MVSQSLSKKEKLDPEEAKDRAVFIKKVILENFLSFQKDEVDFGESKFVIIVGPNWSGKTSIFQAIKFALGSNERDDRYLKWSDFIRNGQNHAMVEIHIQSGELLIKIRRFVIRGQSPFFKIQGANDQDFRKIKVQEIQKLIADLNINPDNQFAFVSQGKIDAIKNLKPTELCKFLEEGIGLKVLRDEILNQKRDVLSLDNDLKSLKSRKTTLSISLQLLTPKLERLGEKNKLLEIRDRFNDEFLWANRDKLENEIKHLKGLIKNIKLVINGIKKKRDAYEVEVRDLAYKIVIEEESINRLTKQLGELNYKKQELTAKIQNWQKEKILVKQELEGLSTKIGEIEKLTTNYEKQQGSLENESKIIKKELKDINFKTAHLIKEQARLVKKIKLNKDLIEEYNQLIKEKETKLSEIRENEKLINSLNDEINQLFQSFKDIEHKLEKNKWFLENPSRNLLLELDKELRKFSLQSYEQESELKQLEVDKAKKVNKLKVLQTSLRERRVILPSSISILKDEIGKRELRVKGPLIEFLKYDDELSYAIESVLGEKLLYSFVAEDWDTLSLLKRLKEKYGAYCNIYLAKKLQIKPLTRISAQGVLGYLAELVNVVNDDIEIKKVIYSKVKNCLVVKDYYTGRQIYNKLNFKGKCVTLAGEQIISYKYVYETPYVKRLKGILSAATQKEQSNILEKEIKSINESISELRVNQSKLNDIQRELFNKKETFNDLLYNFNQKQRITAKKNQLYDQMHGLEKNNSSVRENIEELNNQIKDLKSRTDPDFFVWNDRVNEIPLELNSLNEEKKKWDQKLEENSSILEEVKLKLNEQKNQLELIKLEYEKKKEDFQKADKTAFETYRELEKIELSLDNIEREISDLREGKFEYQNKKTEIEKKSIQITFNLEQENVKLNTFNQDIETKKRDLARINSELGPLFSEEVRLIRPIEEINEDILRIDNELIAYLDVDNSLIVEKDQIMASLKEINKNQSDLENDIKAAIKTEKKLEKTYYDKFSIVLVNLQSRVNQKFEDSQIKSYCSLELKGNFEELGVDIKAATSKEQLKSFTALSGGQVSLISICLILSLQEIKPSPLCMLDEAGMFLDEKNSEVVYQLIKSTLEQNPVQLFIFLPKHSSSLFTLAEKVIGIARIGKNEVSSVFKPKIIKKK